MSDNVDPNKLKETAEASDSAREAFEKLLKVVNDLEKGVKNFNTGMDDANKSLSESAGFGEGLGDRLGDIMGTTSGLNANLSRLASAGLNTSEMFKGFTGSLTKNFNAMAIGVSVVEKMFEATTSLIGATDAALVSFQRQTGAVSTYGTKIMSLERSLYTYGVTMDEAGEATASLVAGIKNLDEMTPSAQKELMTTTAILNEMGIDSQITAQNINFLTNQMGLLPEEAASATRSMLALAKELKTPPQEMASAFQSAQPRLAAFGANAGAVFQKLARNAHNATMEVDTLLSISEQFDRFDTAADSVGKLNAILGGPYLSTIRMVTNTDPTDRLRMLADATRQAGKSFDEMGVYERRMLASAMNLESVGQLALVMAGSFDEVVKPIKLTTEELIDQERKLQDYNTIMEEFNQLMRTFAVDIAGPVIKGIKMLIDGLTYISQNPLVWMSGGLALVTAGAIALTVATGGIAAPVMAVVTAITGLIILAKGFYDLVGGAETFNTIMEKVRDKTDGFGEVIERLYLAFANIRKNLGETGGSIGSFLPSMELFIDFSVALAGGLLKIATGLAVLFEWITSSTVAMTALAVIFAPLLSGFAAIGVIIGVVTAAISGFIMLLGDLFHMIFVGNSPSLIAVFGLLGDAITAVGNAFMFPIKMIGKLMTGLKDLAGLLAGKALSFLSGAISYVFGGGSPSAEVNNGGFSRGEDMDSMAVSIGDEVARAVKEALEGVQMNNKIQLEVSAENGLPQLFDYVIRGVDDKYSARPVNHTLNAKRAGIK